MICAVWVMQKITDAYKIIATVEVKQSMASYIKSTSELFPIFEEEINLGSLGK